MEERRGMGDYLTSAFLNLAQDCGGMLSSAFSCGTGRLEEQSKITICAIYTHTHIQTQPLSSIEHQE